MYPPSYDGYPMGQPFLPSPVGYSQSPFPPMSSLPHPHAPHAPTNPAPGMPAVLDFRSPHNPHMMVSRMDFGRENRGGPPGAMGALGTPSPMPGTRSDGVLAERTNTWKDSFSQKDAVQTPQPNSMSDSGLHASWSQSRELSHDFLLGNLDSIPGLTPSKPFFPDAGLSPKRDAAGNITHVTPTQWRHRDDTSLLLSSALRSFRPEQNATPSKFFPADLLSSPLRFCLPPPTEWEASPLRVPHVRGASTPLRLNMGMDTNP